MHCHTTSSALFAALLLATVSPAALAGPLEVRTPEFDMSETSSGIAHEIKSGLPVNTDPAQFPFEVNKGYVFTDGFKAGIKAGFDSPMGDDMRLKDAAVETQLSLGQIGPSISWGWFTGLDMRVQSSDPNAVSSGPLFKVGSDKLALTLNPKLEHSFGPSHDSTAFAYAAGLKSEVTKGVALGIEAYGSFADIATVPDPVMQAHRGSPSLYVGLGLTPPQQGDANASKFSLEVGALAGMSETAPDLTGRVKAAVKW